MTCWLPLILFTPQSPPTHTSATCLLCLNSPVPDQHPTPPACPPSCPQLLEERDAELERVDSVVAGLREAATSREAALAEARRALSAKEVALREREARWGGPSQRASCALGLPERVLAVCGPGMRPAELGRSANVAACGSCMRHG